MRVFIGTSGWLYEDWDGRFYPQKLGDKDKLPYFAQHFKTVEINSTFYHVPLAKSVQHWYDVTPDDFVFSIKLNQYITHSKRLMPDKTTQAAVQAFYERIMVLKDKLGAVLVQLPPSMQCNIERLNFLLDSTKEFEKRNDIVLPLAFEFRHASWFNPEVFDVLNSARAMVVNNDSPNRWPATVATTGNAMYIRFHGSKQLYRSSYSDEEFQTWARRIHKQRPKTVFAYFNNDYNAVAIENAKRFADLLATPSA